MKKRFIVASASPRRKELLRNAGYEFEIIPSDADETLEDGTSAAEAVDILSRRKAESVSEKNAGSVVLGCDTVVALDGVIFGKPKDKDEAFKMLESLSGKTHTVYTGVCVTDGERTETFVAKTEVAFYALSAETINSYIETLEPMDKAGAYGIQGFGSVLVKGIRGDYFAVMGLPVNESARILSSFGIKGKINL